MASESRREAKETGPLSGSVTSATGDSFAVTRPSHRPVKICLGVGKTFSVQVCTRKVSGIVRKDAREKGMRGGGAPEGRMGRGARWRRERRWLWKKNIYIHIFEPTCIRITFSNEEERNGVKGGGRSRGSL